MTKGEYTFDYGDTSAMAPIVKMHTLGHTFVPPGIHAGGLRYHGMSPSVSALVHHGDIEARAVRQLETFHAAVQFSRAEGILPAPESAHAIRAAIDKALECIPHTLYSARAAQRGLWSLGCLTNAQMAR